MAEMQLKYSKIVDREKKKVEMLLYGVLGEEINGHYFAQELNWLAKNYDEITIRINSDGGSVSHGLSVVSEMLQSQAYIIAKVDGVAASMAAVILAGADKVLMNDYAKVMIHSPYYVDDNGEAISKLSDKDKKGLESIKSTLVTLLTKRGIDEKRIGEMMKTDSWFTADEAKTEGIADEVISTGKKKELASLDVKRLVALIKSENVKSNIEMKEVIAKLGLPENSDEQAVVAAIEKLQTAPPAEPGKPNQKLIDKLIEAGKKAGNVTDKNEASFRTLGETNIDLFCDMLNLEGSIPAPAPAPAPKPVDNTRVSEIVAAMKEAGLGTPVAEKKWVDMTQKELDDLESKQPEAYAKIYKDHFGVDLKEVK
jgi:ATP-dependent protease ClpP protease subunit